MTSGTEDRSDMGLLAGLESLKQKDLLQGGDII